MSLQVDVTKEARAQVRELIQSQTPGTGVRVYLEESGGGCGCGSGGGGCGCGSGSGPRFGMAFDRQRPGDQVVKVDGFSLLVDDLSAELLEGGSIDFMEGLDATGFKIHAPKLSTLRAPAPDEGADGCGCGADGCGAH
ncbi:MAG: hypothetical protein M1126_06965 [Candidatus Thermoplasmatota archaeon]|jgi:Fe-S cluster assembly iron-binding protein IscA|nr:hypothetical protein [Candidatus Thermoplasmatota archaeon]